MSECKHKWRELTIGYECAKCGESIFKPLTYLNDTEKYILKLRAKLEAAQKERDDYQVQMKKYMDDALRLMKDRDNLQTRLVATEREFEELQNEIGAVHALLMSANNQISTWEESYKLQVNNGNKAWQTVNDLQSQVSEREEKYKQSCVKRAEDIEKLLNLQAANAVLVDALKGITRHDAGSPFFDFGSVKREAEYALSITPTQAAERVNAVVEAVNSVRNCLYDALPTGNVTGDKYFMVLIRAIKVIDDALAKYHGKEVE